MRQLLVAGNWKMHGTRESVPSLLEALVSGLAEDTPAEVLVCPPYVYLAEAARLLRGASIRLGAQDLCADSEGAYTGEVSGAMLKEFDCRYVIVGHSERRSLYMENDALVARKFIAAQQAGLVPILCVGESLEEREAGRTEEVVGRQLQAVLRVTGAAAFASAVVAYEPVWAIGTGRTATPEQAQAVHVFLRQSVAAEDAKIAAGLRILYGGSVKAANAAELFRMADIDGALVGGASLDAAEFLKICATRRG